MAQQDSSGSGSGGRSSSRSGATAAGSGSAGTGTSETNPATGAGANGTRGAQPVGQRHAQFMVASQTVPGLAPLSADIIAQSLAEAPGIEIVKTIKPPAALGLQGLALGRSLGSFGAAPEAFDTASGSMVVARMAPEKAELLQSQAGARLVVEHDAPLTYGLDPGPVAHFNPGVLIPLSTGFRTVIEVQGTNGPLQNAEVYVFGSMMPVQGVTDASGRASVSIVGEGPDTIRALYVKPRPTTGTSGCPGRRSRRHGQHRDPEAAQCSLIEGFLIVSRRLGPAPWD